jgi:hypothetical protein
VKFQDLYFWAVDRLWPSSKLRSGQPEKSMRRVREILGKGKPSSPDITEADSETLVEYYRTGLNAVDSKTAVLLNVTSITVAVLIVALLQLDYPTAKETLIAVSIGSFSVFLAFVAIVMLLLAADLYFFDLARDLSSAWPAPGASYKGCEVPVAEALLKVRTKRAALYLRARFLTFAYCGGAIALIVFTLWTRSHALLPGSKSVEHLSAQRGGPDAKGRYQYVSSPADFTSYCRAEIDFNILSVKAHPVVTAIGSSGSAFGESGVTERVVLDGTRGSDYSYTVDAPHEVLKFIVTIRRAPQDLTALPMDVTKIPCAP